MRCTSCGTEDFGGTWTTVTIELREREIQVTPDGTKTEYEVFSGIFHSYRCLADWLVKMNTQPVQMTQVPSAGGVSSVREQLDRGYHMIPTETTPPNERERLRREYLL